ncbi:hypothetical protein HMPREF3038_01934 [Akkermansia sp. KLE1797]|nr:hypothetical protein HMPREF3038_01934 [Akkermansia sp. KLE1797]KXU54659.1 hypothetical protein HMPREF3039_01131 [Akkermansia sp. KLE1798]KZA06003.1 hypothetical protein HMPREF1326_00266 [Akkermansia sp. KLE1605]
MFFGGISRIPIPGGGYVSERATYDGESSSLAFPVCETAVAVLTGMIHGRPCFFRAGRRS